jgi:predicted ferric reductase
VFAVQAIVHSITLLITYVGTGSYAADSTTSWWRWGIVATVLTCAMVVFSSLWFRRKSYELFLASHVVMAVLVIVGCWYHVILRWGFNFYDNWLMAASAVWFFDRALRVLRLAKNGIRYARVTEVGDGFVRVDVPGLRWARGPGYVAFAHFPGVSGWMFWENHPFSVNQTSVFDGAAHAPAIAAAGSASSSSHDIEKHPAANISSSPASSSRDTDRAGTPAGVTLLIKQSTGLTKKLRPNARVLTLLDGPYLFHHPTNALKCDRLLIIGGGIGITSLLPYISSHPNVKLAWSVKSSASSLVHEVEGALARVEKDIRLGERLDLAALLAEEAEMGYESIGVIVCGPGGMCDEVRSRVSAMGRRSGRETQGRGLVWELQVDVFGW